MNSREMTGEDSFIPLTVSSRNPDPPRGWQCPH
jgi:hypothetical protein